MTQLLSERNRIYKHTVSGKCHNTVVPWKNTLVIPRVVYDNIVTDIKNCINDLSNNHDMLGIDGLYSCFSSEINISEFGDVVIGPNRTCRIFNTVGIDHETYSYAYAMLTNNSGSYKFVISRTRYPITAMADVVLLIDKEYHNTNKKITGDL